MTRGRGDSGAEVTGAEVSGAEVVGAEVTRGRGGSVAEESVNLCVDTVKGLTTLGVLSHFSIKDLSSSSLIASETNSYSAKAERLL